MKHTRLVLLPLVFCCFLCVSHAENAFDFSAIPTDELIALRDAINAELSARNFAEKEVLIPEGIYTVGEDIPEGAYIVKHNGTTEYWGIVVVYDKNGKEIFYDIVYDYVTIGKLPLEAGQIVHIKTNPLIFAPYKGLGF